MPFCPNCRDEFEDWVKTCPDCRMALVDELPTLPKTPLFSPEFKETFYRIINYHWLHHALVVIATVIILTILLATHPWRNITESNFASSNAKIRSGQMTVFICNEDGMEQQLIELEWIYPDRHQGKIYEDNDVTEFIVIRDNHYIKSNHADEIITNPSYMVARQMLYRIYDKGKNELIDLLIDIQELPNETIHGINCRHYLARFDVNRYIDNLVDGINQEYEDLKTSNPDLYEDINIEEFIESLNQFREENITIEYWISKSDGIFRQIKMDASELLVIGTHFFDTLSYRAEYYDINHPTVIKPPEVLFRGLLPGWRLVYYGIDTEQSK